MYRGHHKTSGLALNTMLSTKHRNTATQENSSKANIEVSTNTISDNSCYSEAAWWCEVRHCLEVIHIRPYKFGFKTALMYSEHWNSCHWHIRDMCPSRMISFRSRSSSSPLVYWILQQDTSWLCAKGLGLNCLIRQGPPTIQHNMLELQKTFSLGNIDKAQLTWLSASAY